MKTDIFNPIVPKERILINKILEQDAILTADPLTFKILDAIPDFILVLNRQRQVVYANKTVFESLNGNIKSVFGFWPGELLGCLYANEHDGEYGSNQFCSVCGAAKAIEASQKGFEENQECHITQRNGNALDLRVRASPFEKNNEHLTIFTITDISHEKRRLALERIFFHDILNTTSSLVYVSQLLKDLEPSELGDVIKRIEKIANTLDDEIQAQQILNAAEGNELAVQIATVDVHQILREVADIYADHYLTKDRKIIIKPNEVRVTITTDKVLFKRVISNLVKNALEGCPPGNTVTLGSELAGEAVQIWVHNPGHMPREVQLQVFQRSFSTKGRERGLGTYSIKLFTERYLKGKISFTSSLVDGIKFVITLPLVY
jgi:signal transduction histidine kinase